MSLLDMLGYVYLVWGGCLILILAVGSTWMKVTKRGRWALPTWKGSYVGQVIRNTKSYDAQGDVTKRYWRWDGAAWQPYNKPK